MMCGGISAYDASLILQAAAGLINLNTGQFIAADVNKSGEVNTMNSAYVLEKAVGLINLPFLGAGKLWDFNPEERTYDNLDSSLSGQNFTAILLGDVSGNWAAARGSGIQSLSTAELIVGPAGPTWTNIFPADAQALAFDSGFLATSFDGYGI